METMRKQSKQQGFTLVEIAVVLIIIGLLLGAVLQGTELVDNSRIMKASSDFAAVSAAFLSYQDVYKRIPGDDGPNLAALTGRGGEWANVTQFGNNDSILRANLNETWSGGSEHDNVWQHLRAAGYIPGDTSATGLQSLPKNAWGALIGFTAETMGDGLTGTKVCMSQVPGEAASALDLQLDDGLGDSGRLRATLGASGSNTNPSDTPLAAPYSGDDVYTLCRQI
jgi:prepilin-type N-terminal cleavage/methylation domain-containing protein